MHNKYIARQCRFMISSLDAFEQSCKMAALADDGVIDDEEAEELKMISAYTQAYREALKQVVKQTK